MEETRSKFNYSTYYEQASDFKTPVSQLRSQDWNLKSENEKLKRQIDQLNEINSKLQKDVVLFRGQQTDKFHCDHSNVTKLMQGYQKKAQERKAIMRKLYDILKTKDLEIEELSQNFENQIDEMNRQMDQLKNQCNQQIFTQEDRLKQIEEVMCSILNLKQSKLQQLEIKEQKMRDVLQKLIRRQESKEKIDEVKNILTFIAKKKQKYSLILPESSAQKQNIQREYQKVVTQQESIMMQVNRMNQLLHPLVQPGYVSEDMIYQLSYNIREMIKLYEHEQKQNSDLNNTIKELTNKLGKTEKNKQIMEQKNQQIDQLMGEVKTMSHLLKNQDTINSLNDCIKQQAQQIELLSSQIQHQNAIIQSSEKDKKLTKDDPQMIDTLNKNNKEIEALKNHNLLLQQDIQQLRIMTRDYEIQINHLRNQIEQFGKEEHGKSDIQNLKCIPRKSSIKQTTEQKESILKIIQNEEIGKKDKQIKEQNEKIIIQGLEISQLQHQLESQINVVQLRNEELSNQNKQISDLLEKQSYFEQLVNELNNFNQQQKNQQEVQIIKLEGVSYDNSHNSFNFDALKTPTNQGNYIIDEIQQEQSYNSSLSSIVQLSPNAQVKQIIQTNQQQEENIIKQNKLMDIKEAENYQLKGEVQRLNQLIEDQTNTLNQQKILFQQQQDKGQFQTSQINQLKQEFQEQIDQLNAEKQTLSIQQLQMLEKESEYLDQRNQLITQIGKQQDLLNKQEIIIEQEKRKQMYEIELLQRSNRQQDEIIKQLQVKLNGKIKKYQIFKQKILTILKEVIQSFNLLQIDVQGLQEEIISQIESIKNQQNLNNGLILKEYNKQFLQTQNYYNVKLLQKQEELDLIEKQSISFHDLQEKNLNLQNENQQQLTQLKEKTEIFQQLEKQQIQSQATIVQQNQDLEEGKKKMEHLLESESYSQNEKLQFANKLLNVQQQLSGQILITKQLEQNNNQLVAENNKLKQSINSQDHKQQLISDLQLQLEKQVIVEKDLKEAILLAETEKDNAQFSISQQQEYNNLITKQLNEKLIQLESIQKFSLNNEQQIQQLEIELEKEQIKTLDNRETMLKEMESQKQLFLNDLNKQNQEIQRLTNQIRILTEEYEKIKIENNELIATNLTQKKEIQLGIKDMIVAGQKDETQQYRISEYELQIKQITEQLSQEQSECSNQKAQTKQNIQRLEAQFADLMLSYQNQTEQLAQLKIQCSTQSHLSVQNSKLQDEINKLSSQLNFTNKDSNQNLQMLIDLQRKNEQDVVTVEQLNETNKHLQEENYNFIAEKLKLTETIKSLQISVNQLQKQLDLMNDSNKQLMNDKEQLNDNCLTLEQSIRELIIKLEADSTKIKSLQAINKKQELEISTFQQQLKDITCENQTLKDQGVVNLQEIDNELQSVKAIYQNQIFQQSVLQSKVIISEEKAISVEQELKLLQNKFGEIDAQATDQKRQLRELEQEKQLLSNQINQITEQSLHQINKLNSKIVELIEDIRKLESENLKFKIEKEKYQKILQQVEIEEQNKIQDLQTKHEKELQTVKSKHDVLQKSCEEMQNQFLESIQQEKAQQNSLISELNRLQKDLNQEINKNNKLSEVNLKFSKLFQHQNCDRDLSSEKLQFEQQGQGDEVKSLRQDNSVSERYQQISVLNGFSGNVSENFENQMKSSCNPNQKIVVLQEQITQLYEENDKLKRQQLQSLDEMIELSPLKEGDMIKQLKKEIELLRGDKEGGKSKAQLQSEIVELEKKLFQLNETNQKISKVPQFLLDMCEKASIQDRDWMIDLNQLEADFHKKWNIICTKLYEFEQLQGQILRSQNDIQQLQQQLANRENMSIRSVIINKSQTFDDEDIFSMRSTVTKLKQELDQQRGNNQKLKSYIKSFEKDEERFQEQNQRVKDENKQLRNRIVDQQEEIKQLNGKVSNCQDGALASHLISLLGKFFESYQKENKQELRVYYQSLMSLCQIEQNEQVISKLQQSLEKRNQGVFGIFRRDKSKDK